MAKNMGGKHGGSGRGLGKKIHGFGAKLGKMAKGKTDVQSPKSGKY
jgi:hypothetical protein